MKSIFLTLALLLPLCLSAVELTSPMPGNDNAAETAGPAQAGISSRPGSVFQATQTYTMLGQYNAANRFYRVDFSQFTAGSASIRYSYDNETSVTHKGFAYFDLEQGGLRQALKDSGGKHVLLSFVLLQVVDKPRPLRVEFIGTTDDKDSDRSRAQQFQAQPIRRANNVLDRRAEAGTKVVDLTGVIEHTLDKRWLIIRFEMEGYRIEDNYDDIYQFGPNTSTVRLTITDDPKDLAQVTSHYDADGLGGILPDMHKNILPDMQKNILPDMSDNLTPDMSSDILPDMNKQDILPDMDKQSIINDQGN
ncbi:MAG: hypothetical protein AAGF10_05875 [Verrucomicrobiota bacterium]